MKTAVPDENSVDAGPSRPGKYSAGSKTVDRILQAALHILVEEGSTAFTLQRVATECDLKIGNVTRHFPRKEVLVNVLLNEILDSSDKLLKQRVYDTDMSPEDALFLVITETMENIKIKQTTHLFTEIWAMSNHNEILADRLDALYRYVHTLIGSFVKQLNPSLNADQVETVSIFIDATMIGTVVLAGHSKPWEPKIPILGAMAAKVLINMVKTITPDEIEALLTGPEGALLQSKSRQSARTS